MKADNSENKKTETEEESILKLIRFLEGKKIFLATKSNLKYTTDNLQVINNKMVVFTDKYGLRVALKISDITQLSEIYEGDRKD